MEFRPATRRSAKPLIGLYGESGSGKTYSALLLARGFVGPKGTIGMIETESGRGEAYADLIAGGYNVLSIREPFSPIVYGEAIALAEKSNFDALIIDSASHEWEGAGGVLSMAAANQEKGIKGVLVWQQPKIHHQRHFMLRLMQTPISLVIVCMRAKYPMTEQIKDGKREWVRSEQLEPKQSEDILYEIFCHGWIDREHRFHATKYTRPDLASVIRDGEAITLETGQRLKQWASGDNVAEPESRSDTAGVETMTAENYVALWEIIIENATEAADLAQWNSEAAQRRKMQWAPGQYEALKNKIFAAVAYLKEPPQEAANDQH